MLLTENFLNLDRIPNFDEFELIELINYYKNILCNYNFIYTCFSEKENKEFIIELIFLPENFIHLVSLDSVIPKRYGNRIILEKLENQEWDKLRIKKFNPKMFGKIKKRMRLLTTVYSILKNLEIIHFNPDNVVNGTNILSSFLITEIKGSEYVHLGIDGPNEVDGKYFPRTLLGENSDKFIDEQEFYRVKEVKMIKKSV